MDPSESGQLSESLERVARQEQFIFRDDSAYMKEQTDGQFIVFMTMYRPLQGGKEWPEVQVHAEGEHSPWVLFLPPASDRYERATAASRQHIMAALRAKWPDLRTIPILPHGSVPLAKDLVLTAQGYKVAAERASRYELPPNSSLVAG